MAKATTSVDYLPDADSDMVSDLRPTYTPFPTELLPPAAAAIVRAGAESIGCEAAYLALPALAALAGAIGNTRHAIVKKGWIEPACVWAMLVGPSGTAKTPAAKIVLGPLHERHGRLIAANEAAMKEHAAEMKRYEAQLANWRRKPEGEPPEEPVAPELERVVIEDTTIEALAPILKANPRGVLLHRDELAGWFGSFDRYAQNGGGDVARWLSIFNAEPITVDRRTSGTTYVPRPAVSVIGGIQPDRLPVVLTRTLRDSGLLARLLLAHPPAAPKRFNADDLDAVAIEAWTRLQNYLSTLEMGSDDEGRPTPVFIGMVAAAKKFFGQWADTFNAITTTMPSDIAAARSKLEAYAVRFALILAVGEAAAKIEARHIEAGCALADWFAAEADRIYDSVGHTDEDRDTGALLAWIESRGGRATVREIISSGPRKWRNKTTAAKAMLHSLVTDGMGVWEHDTARPGRPSKSFVLNAYTTPNKECA